MPLALLGAVLVPDLLAMRRIDVSVPVAALHYRDPPIGVVGDARRTDGVSRASYPPWLYAPPRAIGQSR